MRHRGSYVFGAALLAVFGLGLAWAGDKTPEDSRKAADRSRGSPLTFQTAGGGNVDILDDCDPTDPAWNATGGCDLRTGDVNFQAFLDGSFSPLSLSIVGHPAWRIEPMYLKVKPGESVKARNKGGRDHTFTEVENFGGGVVGLLNQGLTLAPECLSSTVLEPGEKEDVTDLDPGDHRFQCCIHPWMRTLVKVNPAN
jgi:plastocyanin